MRKFVEAGQTALLFGGLLLAAGAALGVWGPGGLRFSAWIGGTEALVAGGLRLTGTLLVLWGLTALHVRQADRVGWFGLGAYLVAALNLVVNAAWMFSDLFIAPTFAVVAPQVLDGTGPTPGRIGTGFAIAWLTNVGSLLFGVAVFRAGVYRRACAVLLMLGGALFFVPMPFDGPAYEAILGALFALAGVVAVRSGLPLPAAADGSALTVADQRP